MAETSLTVKAFYRMRLGYRVLFLGPTVLSSDVTGKHKSDLQRWNPDIQAVPPRLSHACQRRWRENVAGLLVATMLFNGGLLLVAASAYAQDDGTKPAAGDTPADKPREDRQMWPADKKAEEAIKHAKTQKAKAEKILNDSCPTTKDEWEKWSEETLEVAACLIAIRDVKRPLRKTGPSRDRLAEFDQALGDKAAQEKMNTDLFEKAKKCAEAAGAEVDGPGIYQKILKRAEEKKKEEFGFFGLGPMIVRDCCEGDATKEESRPEGEIALAALSPGLNVTATEAADAPEEFYFLKVGGRAAPLTRVAVNGAPVLRGMLQSVSLPVPVTRQLKAGSNTLEVEYISDAQQGLTVVVERRRRGSPQREDVARLTSAPGETQGKSAVRTARFTLAQAPPARKALTLTEGDREQIRALIRTHYDALARRDSTAASRVFETAVNNAREVYPEGVEFHDRVMGDASRRILASPKFKMRPLRLEKLDFRVNGDVVTVGRSDGQPIFESEEIEEDKSKTKLEPRGLLFQQAAGKWYSTLPTLVF